MIHPSVTFVGSPLPLQQSLSGTISESCGKNDEGTNFGFGRMAQMMRHLPTRAEILSFTLPDLICGSWRKTQLVLLYLAVPHQRKGKVFKVTLMQPAAGETETDRPTWGQVREVHSFCVSSAMWLLVTDGIARSTRRVAETESPTGRKRNSRLQKHHWAFVSFSLKVRQCPGVSDYLLSSSLRTLFRRAMKGPCRFQSCKDPEDRGGGERDHLRSKKNEPNPAGYSTNTKNPAFTPHPVDNGAV